MLWGQAEALGAEALWGQAEALGAGKGTGGSRDTGVGGNSFDHFWRSYSLQSGNCWAGTIGTRCCLLQRDISVCDLLTFL